MSQSQPPTNIDSGVTANNPAQNAGTNNHQSNGSAGGLKDTEGEITAEQAQAEGLPEQKHAGAVGYGPAYANKNKTTFGDKVAGVKEQLMGKIKKDPELVQRGVERRTGELKKKELGEDDSDPFTNPQKKETQANAPKPEADAHTDSGTPGSSASLGLGKSSEVDTAAGQSRLSDPAHPVARDEGVPRAAGI